MRIFQLFVTDSRNKWKMYISVRNNINAADLHWKYTFVYEKSSWEIDKIIKRLRRETIKKLDFLCYRYIL